MERAGVNLPDFSRGEGFVDVACPSFEPIFVGSKQSTGICWQQIDDRQDSLAGLSSAIDELDGMRSDLVEQHGGQEENSMSLAEHELILRDHAKHHADEIDELTNAHQQEVLKKLEEIQLGFHDAVAKRIETALADVLSKLFQERLTEICIEKLVREIRTIILKSPIDHLQISGPPQLVSAMVDVLPSGSFAIECEETDGIDLTVSFNEKSISTNISDWMKELDKALAS